MIYIYALIDPFTDAIRYIGKSIRPKERLTNHCNEHGNSWRHHWLQSVLQRGKRPRLRILQELPDDANWQYVETWWIAHGKAEGWQLTNCTDGGDGVTNLSGESKERMMQTWKGRKHRPESKLKMAQASTGKRPSAESLAKRSLIFKGRTFTEEWLLKISIANGKLIDEQVRYIRELLAMKVSQYTIADMFDVHQGTISNIKRCKMYTHVL